MALPAMAKDVDNICTKLTFIKTFVFKTSD